MFYILNKVEIASIKQALQSTVFWTNFLDNYLEDSICNMEVLLIVFTTDTGDMIFKKQTELHTNQSCPEAGQNTSRGRDLPLTNSAQAGYVTRRDSSIWDL